VIGGTRKDAGEGEGQLERGHVTVALDGVDALAGDAGGVGKLLLRPALGDAKFLDAVYDGGAHVKLTFHSRVARIGFDVKPTRYYLLDKPKRKWHIAM